MDRAIAYYRVSTRAQGRSGLGIEAQRAALLRFAKAENISIIAENVETESGKGSDALLRGRSSGWRSTRRATHAVP